MSSLCGRFGGLFTVLFVRKIGGSKTGATISAILFSFCGFLIIWQGQAMSDAAIWLPLICYSLFGSTRNSQHVLSS